MISWKRDHLEGLLWLCVLFFFFLSIRYHLQEVFPQPCFVQVTHSTTHVSALSSFTTINDLTLFILLVSLLSSSWHRLNLIWARVSLSLTPPLPRRAVREQKRAFVKELQNSSCPAVDSLQPTRLSFSFLAPQLFPHRMRTEANTHPAKRDTSTCPQPAPGAAAATTLTLRPSTGRPQRRKPPEGEPSTPLPSAPLYKK